MIESTEQKLQQKSTQRKKKKLVRARRISRHTPSYDQQVRQ